MRSILSPYLLTGALLMAAGVAGATAGPVEPKRLKASTKAELIKIGDAGSSGITLDDSTDDMKVILSAGWLLTNETQRNGTMVPVALSESGKAKYASLKPSEGTASTGSTRINMRPEDFEIDDDVPMPDFGASRREARAVYPFERLTRVGQSFFIPAPEAFPADKDFASARQGTVGTMNRKLKGDWEADTSPEKPEKPIAFKVANDTKNGVRGARVFRVS